MVIPEKRLEKAIKDQPALKDDLHKPLLEYLKVQHAGVLQAGT